MRLLPGQLRGHGWPQICPRAAATWIARAFAFSAKRESGARNRREVTLFEDLPMMQFVSGDNVRQRAHSDFVFVGHASPRPSLFPQRLEKCDCGRAHQRELFGQVQKRALSKISFAHVVVLLEPLKRALVASRNPQCAVSKNTLTVAHVTEHFLHRPLVRGVTEITVALAARGK